ncbi:hypothetical protein [Paracidobacterium acidisoli]|uniref:Uncharacterized protein n=1 Tax=Paracidobacterium acidisoli TaxID=2303751 RepID=A0A372IQD4_9BACT|nr:hypothetical protein [Paracidobacterium acidisoli]MBT9331523.1 hypothetical protein [Paracidobacterium acidisoli]
MAAVLAAGQATSAQSASPMFPRKTVTFYTPGSAAIPKALGSTPLTLPEGEMTAAATAGDVMWIGTNDGLVRYQAGAGESESTQYLAGRRYLPDNHVLGILPNGNRGVWVRTGAGAAYIDYRPITLAAKADLFEAMQGARHFRYGLVSDAILDKPGDLTHSHTTPADNDGLWTSMYAAAECFHYAADHSPAALARAHRSLDAVLFLSQVTGIPGYPARSFVRRGDAEADGPEWHDSKDGRYRWKGDTSSDEIVGHFFLYSVAYDLLPDPASRQRIAATVRAIATNILDHGYNLVGESGQPTTWGRWSPEYFRSEKGRPDAPLNAIELLSILRTAAHITGDGRFATAYQHAALELGYAALGTRYLELREEINCSDEELFMLSIYPLMHDESDPALIALYQTALDQWWQNERREENPLWSFLYQKITRRGRIPLHDAIARLGRMPLDTIGWSVMNSTRHDLRMNGGLYRGHTPQASRLLPPDELPIQRWNSSPFCVDGWGDGRREEEFTTFLLPYWTGRAFHLL